MPNRLTWPRQGQLRGRSPRNGFTFIEIVIVVTIIGTATALLLGGVGTFTYWREDGFLRRFSETIQFLHRQAQTDLAFYRMEFDLERSQYSVRVVRSEGDFAEKLDSSMLDAGNLSLELAMFISPALGREATLIPPPSMPSFADPVPLPSGMRFRSVRTTRGIASPPQAKVAHMLFSPRGFSEFAVIHLQTAREQDITLLVNPFTGLVEIFREFRDFEWTYNKRG